MSRSLSAIPARRASTADKRERRAVSSPRPVRRGVPYAVPATSACTSTNIGRLPSRSGATTAPGARSSRSSIKARPGSSIPARPFSPISSRPSSSVEPKRFFAARSVRRVPCRSPSSMITASTRCSSVFGPAMLPSLVTWPTRITAAPVARATLASTSALPRTWPTLPAGPSSSASVAV